MASVWNESMLEWANSSLPIHKVGSGDLTCYPMLALLAKTNKPIILSTGLSSMKEVHSADEAALFFSPPLHQWRLTAEFLIIVPEHPLVPKGYNRGALTKTILKRAPEQL